MLAVPSQTQKKIPAQGMGRAAEFRGTVQRIRCGSLLLYVWSLSDIHVGDGDSPDILITELLECLLHGAGRRKLWVVVD
jgi:hypothetical protein